MNNITKILLFILFTSISAVTYSQSTPKRNTVAKSNKVIKKRRASRAKTTRKAHKTSKKQFIAMQTKNTRKMMKKARKRA